MPKRILEGEVVSNKTDKTITVLVERRFRHPVYKKYIRKTDKYAAHDETNTAQVGDRVRIIECRPISKTKRWTLLTDGAQTEAAPKTDKKKAEAKKEAAPKVEEKKTKAETKETAEKKKAPAKKKSAAKKTTAKKTADKKTTKKDEKKDK